MAIITTVSGGIATSTDTKTGKVTTSSVYGSSPSSPGVETQKTAQGQTVTIRRAGSTSKPKLTEDQLASESQRISEEIQKYGYYTPMEQAGDEYYQTAPELSPSRYIQTPDSEEGRRIISRHPAGELAYEGSAQWITPTQAEAKLRAGIESGEYTTQKVGYKTEVGVRGEGGVAYYGDDVLLGQLIRKKEPKGVQLDYGPDIVLGELDLKGERYKEVRTKSLLGDIVGSGAGVLKETEGGFEIQWTEAGKQQKSFWLQQLQPEVPSYWLMKGTSDKLIFGGMPYTTTTTTEGGKTTKVVSDFYGKEMERTVEISPMEASNQVETVLSKGMESPFAQQGIVDWGKVGVKSLTQEQMIKNVQASAIAGKANYDAQMQALALSAPSVGSPGPFGIIGVNEQFLSAPTIGKITVPGKMKTYAETEAYNVANRNEYLYAISAMDKFIESSPLGTFKQIGVSTRNAILGKDTFEGVVQTGLTRATELSKGTFMEPATNWINTGQTTIGNLTPRQVIGGGARFGEGYFLSVYSLPEDMAKIGARVYATSTPFVAQKFIEGKGNKYISDAGGTLGGIGVGGLFLIGKTAVGAATNPIGTAYGVALGTVPFAEQVFFDVGPSVAAGFTYASIVSGLSAEYQASKTPVKTTSLQGEFGDYNRYQTNTFVQYQSGKQRLFTKTGEGFSEGMSYYDDVAKEVRFTNVGIMKGQPGSSVSVNIAKVGDDIRIPDVDDAISGKLLNIKKVGQLNVGYYTADDTTYGLYQGGYYTTTDATKSIFAGKTVRDYSIRGTGINLKSGNVDVWVGDISAEVSGPTAGFPTDILNSVNPKLNIPTYSPKMGFGIGGEGYGTTYGTYSYGYSTPLTGSDKATMEMLYSNSKYVPKGWEIKGGSDTIYAGGTTTIIPNIKNVKPLTIASDTFIFQLEKSPIAPPFMDYQGMFGGIKYAGPSVEGAGYAISGGGSGGATVQVVKNIISPKGIGGIGGLLAKEYSQGVMVGTAGSAIAGAIAGAGALVGATKVITTPKVSTIPKVGSTTSILSITRTSTTPKISTIPKITTMSMERIMSVPKVSTSSASLTSEMEKILQIPKQTTSQTQGLIQIPKITPLELAITGVVVSEIVVPIHPPPEGGDKRKKGGDSPWELGFAGGSWKGLSTKRKLPTKYKPSLLGIVTGYKIKKAPKFVSGAEWMRGIVSGGKKKRKKGKRRK